MESEQLIDLLNQLTQQIQSNIHTATVAIVTSVNSRTINCKPAINRVVDGQSIELPEFIEVPPIFLAGGSSHIAMPIKAGDECLLIFSERCFDRWYHGQNFIEPLELRMHDYSDGFALVGIKSLAKAISIPDVIEINGDTVLTGDLSIQGNVVIEGDLTVSGKITCAQLEVNGSDYSNHTHRESDGGTTSSPIS